jgi:dTDP-4-amino-4,6-dideoxygalactose transaminase
VKIKLVDLAAQNREIRDQVEREFAAIHEQTAYVGGPQVAAFETEFAAFLGARYLIGVGSGTDALRLSLMALGIGPGDEVITTPMTFIATAEAIVQTGARPAFVDIDPATGNMSVAALVRYLGDNFPTSANGPRAIVPVHLYGLPAPLIELRQVADTYGLKLVEDACQAHGARVRDGERWAAAGTVGEAGCFSFYPGKNLGAWGEGGAVATGDEELADEVRRLRDHGRLSHYAHAAFGYNARRRAIAACYRELLAPCGVEPMLEPEGVESCYHLFVVRSALRDAIRQALIENQIECGIHYPVPLHLQPACRYLGYRKGDFPAAEALADSVLSLPMHPHLSAPQVQEVSRVVALAVARS